MLSVIDRGFESRSGRISVQTIQLRLDVSRRILEQRALRGSNPSKLPGGTNDYRGRLTRIPRAAERKRTIFRIRRPGRFRRTVATRRSAEAEVVFLGLATPKEGEEGEYAERLDALAGDLPTVFFVKNASCFIGGLLGETEPDRSPQPTAKPEVEPEEASEGEKN